MKKGDEVEWTSQSAGFQKTKVGKIIAVVPAGKLPTEVLDTTVEAAFEFDGVMPRNHESYLVMVDRGEGRKPALYWPVASKLKPVKKVEEKIETAPGELPGIPPPGPLHTAVKKFVTQRLKIEDERKALKPLSEDILKAMKEEGMSSLSIPVAGDTYLFNVAQTKEKLQMRRARKKELTISGN